MERLTIRVVTDVEFDKADAGDVFDALHLARGFKEDFQDLGDSLVDRFIKIGATSSNVKFTMATELEQGL